MSLERLAQLVGLLDPFADENAKRLRPLFRGPATGRYGCFHLLRNVAAGDAVILEAEVAAVAVLMQMRLQIFEREVPADVAVKFAVDVVARISDLGAPDLLAGLDVAGKNSTSVRADDRSMHAVTRPRVAVKDRVRVADKIFDPGVLQQIFDARLVGTFGQPDAARLPPEMLFVICDRDLESAPGVLPASRSAAKIRASLRR